MRKRLPLLLLLLCAALFGGTIYLLIKDRFESGDVYPPSSSLRSDPLGAMILFESLRALPGVKVQRDHNAVNRLPAGQQTTYLHLAAKSGQWREMPPDLYRVIDRFLLEGGRLVITLTPQYRIRETPVKDEPEKEGDADKKEDKDPAPKDEKPKKEEKDRSIVSLEEKWGLKLTQQASDDPENIARNVSTLPLPPEVKWNGNIVLQDPDASWQVLYKTDRGAVLAEKKRGPGSIVIVTDSYFVSNEALVRDRHPELLAWLVGSSDHIVFDEAHHGIRESPGIAALARKYQLHGGVAALIILAALFIWKSSSPLAPLRATSEKSGTILMGRTSGAGFVSLLKRNIPANRVLEICLEEWRKAFSHSSRFTPQEKAAVEEIARAETAAPSKERDPVTAYQKICTALRRHRS
jgi:hypothetical protein